VHFGLVVDWIAAVMMAATGNPTITSRWGTSADKKPILSYDLNVCNSTI